MNGICHHCIAKETEFLCRQSFRFPFFQFGLKELKNALQGLTFHVQKRINGLHKNKKSCKSG